MILGGQRALEEAIQAGDLIIQGDGAIIKAFFDSLESFITAPLIEPK